MCNDGWYFQLYAFFSLFVVILSTVIFILTTQPELDEFHEATDRKEGEVSSIFDILHLEASTAPQCQLYILVFRMQISKPILHPAMVTQEMTR